MRHTHTHSLQSWSNALLAYIEVRNVLHARNAWRCGDGANENSRAAYGLSTDREYCSLTLILHNNSTTQSARQNQQSGEQQYI